MAKGANKGGGNYAVGRGRPPKHTRWKKGQSGNPRGRPKKRSQKKRDLIDELEQEGAEQISVHENGKAEMMSKRKAFIKGLYNRALNGNPAAAKLLMSMMTHPKRQQPDLSEADASDEDIRKEFKLFLDGMAARSTKPLDPPNQRNDNGKADGKDDEEASG